MICGKVIYTSRTEANQALRGANKVRKPGESVNRLNTTYFCDDCQGWHVASKCKKMWSKKKTTEMQTNPTSLHPKKMKRERGFLIIRNYSSKPI